MTQLVLWKKSTYDDWTFYIAATEEGLCYVSTPYEGFETLQKWAKKQLPKATLQENDEQLAKYESELFEYLNGTREHFTLPIRFYGTHFQRAVWRALLKVPFGQVITYSEIAENIQNPKAVRAVGAAIGANPLLFVIPCHRVIGKDGKLTGFRGGLEMKKALLGLENSLPS